jgi:hypothetical protein
MIWRDTIGKGTISQAISSVGKILKDLRTTTTRSNLRWRA